MLSRAFSRVAVVRGGFATSANVAKFRSFGVPSQVVTYVINQTIPFFMSCICLRIVVAAEKAFCTAHQNHK
jgi:hypothetical protein